MGARIGGEIALGSCMDALLLRSLQSYMIDTFGVARWQTACRRAHLEVPTFEPMLHYDPGLADQMAEVVAEVLGRPVEAVWEDVGIYLVTHPDREGVRRLLRFGGATYAEFLHSLEEMPGRARLAMPDLELPEVVLDVQAPDRYRLRCPSHLRATQRVLVGLLTAMADDYGTLCLITPGADDCTEIAILDGSHAAARRFDLAMPGG